MDDQQADPGETTGISTSSSTTTPPLQSSSCRSGGDEPDKFVGGARGSASRRRERGADQQLGRNRLNKGRGGVRFQAAGHDQDGGSTVQADGGRVGDPADESTAVRRFQAKHEDGRSMGPSLHKKKMGQQADQEETSTGISTRAPPVAGRSGDDADNNIVGGVPRASRPRGRWAADYRPSRNRLSEGYYYGGVCDLRPDEGFRFQAAGQYDQDGGSMVHAADGAGRIRDPVDENTVHFQAAGHDQDGRSMIISRAPPPAGRSGDEPYHNFDGGVVLGASRPRGRRAADYRPSRIRLDEGYYYGGGVRDLPDEDFRFQAELEYYGYLGPSHTKMDHQAEGETTGTGSSTPPPPPCRSGGQPDNFVGGLLGASRPRGRWAADYRPGRNRPNRGYGGVRDLRPDEGDCFPAAGHDQDGRSTVGGDGGGVHFQAEQQEDGCMVRSPDGGVRDQADGDPRSHETEHESGSAVPADGSGRDPADGGVRFRAEHEDGGLRVYDNVVVGDPSGVIFGRRNYAGGKVRGQVSGNRVIR